MSGGPAGARSVGLISSNRNGHVQRVRKLSKRGVRDKLGQFVVEGVTGVSEALGSRHRVKALFVQSPMSDPVQALSVMAERGGVPVFEVSESVMSHMSPSTTPPGAIAIADFVDQPWQQLCSQTPDLAVILSDIRDPGNVGTILRTAWAFGAGGVFLSSSTADVYNPKVVRATAGALFHLPFARDIDVESVLQQLKGRSLAVAAVADGTQVVWDMDMSGPVTLILGNEAWGIDEVIRAAADVEAAIPLTHTAESLNVAVAAAVFMAEAMRQRRAV